MQQSIGFHRRNPLPGLALVLMVTLSFTIPASACTIFVLTDGHRVLFCNNEDWTNPATRIWFVPAGTGYYGCVYVGYSDGWARGGMNTEGLACDWVGGFSEKWQSDPATCVRGNPTERLLESCATVEDAIAFFRNHKEPDFIRARIFVADRNGISAIIGAQDGRLQVYTAARSRGFGFASQTFRACFAKDSTISVGHGASILHACLQDGKYATKYSNIFDLTSGDIYLYQFHQKTDSIRMNLTAELGRGGHYFEMVQIHRQLSAPAMPLPMNMKRLVMDDFPPISDPEPVLTKHIRAVIQDAIDGTMRAGDYQAELWSSISPIQTDIQQDLQRYGGLRSVTLVERRNEGRRRINCYLIEFDNIRSLMRFEIDDQERIVSSKSEATERQPGADLGE